MAKKKTHFTITINQTTTTTQPSKLLRCSADRVDEVDEELDRERVHALLPSYLDHHRAEDAPRRLRRPVQVLQVRV